MKHQHGRAVLYRAGEPVFEGTEFIILDFFVGPASGSFCVKAKTNNNSKLHIVIYKNMIKVLQNSTFRSRLTVSSYKH